MSTVNPAAPVAPVVPEGHVGIEIDGQHLAVPKGSMIIEAADKAGIPIPRFCYHDKLSIAANCRMCLVEVEKMPKPAPACATPVMDGMKVLTRSDKALGSQRNVMEFLLVNHPLDCPICDQGGECELQDVSMGYGRSVSRYVDRKRVVPDEDLGPLVATEMTRCIQCTRCVRFTAEIAGTYELGGMYRGENLQIGTYDGKPLTTELSGNVVDVCPVGALTNKVFQFKARPWELTAKPSLGYHDALGSNLYLHLRRGEVLRTVPRENDDVNESWLSDRDRYSHQGLQAADRAQAPMIREGDDFRVASWDEALTKAAEILRDAGGEQSGFLVHPSTTNEEGALLARIAAQLGSGNIDHRISQLDLSDAATAEASPVAIASIARAARIVLVGTNLRAEMPLLLHRVRQAQRKGAKVFAVNPVEFDFSVPMSGIELAAPSTIATALGDSALIDAVKGAEGDTVVIVGGIAENSAYAAAIRAAALKFADAVGGRVVRIPQGANAVGLSRYGVLPTGDDALAMTRKPRSAYVLYGIEPGLDFADVATTNSALKAAKVVAFSQYACRSTRAVADVILPIGALPEIDGSLTNMDGEDQFAVAGAKLPNEARPGWRVLRVLGEKLGAAGFDFTDWNGLQDQMQATTVSVSSTSQPRISDGAVELATSLAIYRSDATVRRAQALQEHPLNVEAGVVMHPEDAAAAGIAAGQVIRVQAEVGQASLPVRLNARVAKGVAWVELGHGATAALAASTHVNTASANPTAEAGA